MAGFYAGRIYSSNAERQAAYRKRKRIERLLKAGFSMEQIEYWEKTKSFPKLRDP